MQLLILSSTSKQQFLSVLAEEQKNLAEFQDLAIVIDGPTLVYALEDSKVA